jgi:ABC-type amino acid transport system permease subunit
VIAKNLLLGAGAYYIAAWLSMPLAIAFGKLTQGHIYTGDFSAAFVMPLVTNLPKAIVAAAAGAVLAWLIESERPVVWAIFPALLYGVLGFLGYRWARPPAVVDRVKQTIGALFPALACVVGALVAERHRARLQAISDKS